MKRTRIQRANALLDLWLLANIVLFAFLLVELGVMP